MKIGLNATCFNTRPSGAKQRFLGLYRPAIETLQDAQFIVYSAADTNVEDWFRDFDNVLIRHTPVPSEGRWNRIISGLGYWPMILRKDRLDLLEGFHMPPTSNPCGRMAMTIHDLRGLYSHTQYSRRSVFRAVLERSIRKSDEIITVSETMKQEIASAFPNAQITRIYNGIESETFARIDDEAANKFIRNGKLPNDFLLAVGHYELRKNYARLIDAIILLNGRGSAIPLVIAGNDSGQLSELQQRVSHEGLDKQIILLQNLDDDQVCWLYNKCRMFIFPSSYEGFGIPLLEAMASGKPFLLSDLAVFRELSEHQGIYFPYENSRLMAASIDKLAGSTEEQERLVNYGRARVKDFSFDLLSKQLVSFYKDFL